MKDKNSKKNILIICVSIILLIVSLLLIISSLKKNSDSEKENTNVIVDKDGYKTKDNKYNLSIIGKNEKKDVYESAKLRYGENDFDEYIMPRVKYYAYLNDRVFAIDDVVEDDVYALYYLIGLPTEDSGHQILVNKTNNTIEVSDEDLSKVNNSCFSKGFCGFQTQPNFIKSSTGHYFTNNDHGLITVYTTKWQKIGYIDKSSNIKVDVDGGIFLYESVEKTSCNGSYCEYAGIGNLIKYDVNGKKY